ncbi:MAG: DsbA family protein, partial [Patescibacteria group bacterium]
SDEQEHRARSWVATIVTLLFVFALVTFVARILFYTKQIRSGQVDVAHLNFNKTVSTISKLASQPITDKQTDVVTADDPSIGTLGGPLTIVEFADFGCPYSKESSFVVRSLAAKYPDKVRFIYRDFPIPDLRPIAKKAAEAGECAHEQGKFWEYHDKMYQNQSTLDEASFDVFALSLNLNVQKFQTCLQSGKYAAEVAQDYEDGVNADVRGTPTFFINGNRVAGAIPEDILEKVILTVGDQTKK